MEATHHVNVRERAHQGIATLLETIEKNIRTGVWEPGAKLPTERELEVQLGVSRNTLRRGLRRLENEGKIVRHVGRGSFVADQPMAPRGHADARALSVESNWSMGRGGRDVSARDNSEIEPASGDDDLRQKIRDASPVDIMEVRLMIEPPAAELAARRASAASLSHMVDSVRRMKEAQSIPEYEYWDGQLHFTIIAAARNELMAVIYEAINEARNQPEWEQMKSRSVTPAVRAVYQEQHERIVAALMKRDAERARSEVYNHLLAVRDNLVGQDEFR